MTEEKKSKIRKTVATIQIAMTVVLIGYLIYTLATKHTNTMIFNILAVVLITASVILNDFIEPYLTEAFVQMDEFRKSAYRSYLFWDIASMAGILFFVLKFTESANMLIYLGLVVYFIGTKQKRSYQAAFLGNVTKEDVEAAKAAVVDAEEVLETEEK